MSNRCLIYHVQHMYVHVIIGKLNILQYALQILLVVFEHCRVINQQILTTTYSFCLPVGIPSSSAILAFITDTC